jgi:hypothetical protein
MTREDVKKIFPEATDEQITAFLNQSNSDVAREKAKAQKWKHWKKSWKNSNSRT